MNKRTKNSPMKSKVYQNGLLVLALATGVFACSQESSEVQTLEAGQPERVLATVNGAAITDGDVERMINRTFSQSQQVSIDNGVRDKILGSLIASKAMRLTIAAELSAEKTKQLSDMVKAYEEELYVKEYLLEYAQAKPVSTKMVQDYYARNAEEFGGGELRTFELLKTSTKPSEEQRDLILQNSTTIQSEDNWSEFANTQGPQMGLSYLKSKMSPGLLEPQLESLIKQLDVGSSSGIIFIKGLPHIVRVTDITDLPAKPLANVSAGIRKKLAALQLRKSIKAASEDVLKNAVIERK